MSMNTNSTPNMSGSPRGFGRNAVLAAVGGSVVLMAVVGGGLWARSDSREASAPAEAAAVQPPSNTLVAPVGAAQVLKSQDMVWIYIVGSEAEAAELRNAAASVPGSPSQIIVLPSSAEARYAADLHLGLNSVRAAVGQPQVKVLMVGQLAAAQ